MAVLTVDIKEVYKGSVKLWPPEYTVLTATTTRSDVKIEVSYTVITLVDPDGIEHVISSPNGVLEQTITFSAPGEIIILADTEFVNGPDSTFRFTTLGGDLDNATIKNGVSAFQSIDGWFSGQRFLQYIVVEGNTSHITSMVGTFYDCQSLGEAPEGLDLSSCLNASEMFSNCYSLNNLELTFPVAETMDGILDMSGVSSYPSLLRYVTIEAPLCTSWVGSFKHVNVEYMYLVMGDVASTACTSMFEEAGDTEAPMCVSGTLDTTNATTTSNMFTGSVLSQPNAEDQADLLAGAVKSYPDCNPYNKYVIGIATGDSLPYRCEGIIGATITDSGGEVHELDCSGIYDLLVGLPAGEFTADFEGIDPEIGSDAYFAFGQDDWMELEDAISELTIVNLKGLTSLYNFVARLREVTVNVDVDTSQVWNMCCMFMWNVIDSFPTMNYSSVTTSNNMFARATANVPLVLDMPIVQDTGYMFNCEADDDYNPYQGSFMSIDIKIPSSINTQKMFNDLNGDCTIHVEMGVGLAVDTSWMFKYVGRNDGPLCITGYLDTTAATDTSSMFESSDIYQPAPSDQTELINGASKTYDDCPPPPELLNEAIIVFEVVNQQLVESIKGLALTLENISYDELSNIGEYATFNTNSYMHGPEGMFYDNIPLGENFTFSLFALSNGSNLSWEYARRGNTDEYSSQIWEVDVSNGYLTFSAEDTDNVVCWNTFTDTVEEYVFIHFVIVKEGSEMHLYKDGVFIETQPTELTTIYPDTMYDNIERLGSSTFAGNIAQFGIWNRALSPAEIERLYNAGHVLPVSEW
jgi:hypothetical protein